MNAFYVTVSIPLLLVLAGFNHAHGLTTFGKSTPQNHQSNTNLFVKAKQCTSQANCNLIKNTTCLRGLCLCGDHHPPNNGECTAALQGPNHICTKNEDCVDNADCFPIKDLKLSKELSHLSLTPDLSICRCQEGFPEIGATCGGAQEIVTDRYGIPENTEPPFTRAQSKVKEIGKVSLENKDIVESYETEETEKLSTAQLQRVVFLEQLKLIRMQKRRLLIQLSEL